MDGAGRGDDGAMDTRAAGGHEPRVGCGLFGRWLGVVAGLIGLAIARLRLAAAKVGAKRFGQAALAVGIGRAHLVALARPDWHCKPG